MKRKYELDINESCWEGALGQVPESAGIYFAYACYRGAEPNSWFSGPLVYIGESDNLRRRLGEHAAQRDNHRGLGEQYEKIWYTYALFSESEADRRRCESALIYKHRPLQNEMSAQAFEHPPTEIVLRGETRGLAESFSVGV